MGQSVVNMLLCRLKGISPSEYDGAFLVYCIIHNFILSIKIGPLSRLGSAPFLVPAGFPAAAQKLGSVGPRPSV